MTSAKAHQAALVKDIYDQRTDVFAAGRTPYYLLLSATNYSLLAPIFGRDGQWEFYEGMEVVILMHVPNRYLRVIGVHWPGTLSK